METFMTAYVAVWLAVMLYVARMGIRQRRLQQTLDDLQAQIEQDVDSGEPPAKAA